MAPSRTATEDDTLPPPAFLPGLREEDDALPGGGGGDSSESGTGAAFRRAGDLDGAGVADLLQRIATELRSERSLASWPGPEAGALEAALRGLVAGYLLARDPRQRPEA